MQIMFSNHFKTKMSSATTLPALPWGGGVQWGRRNIVLFSAAAEFLVSATVYIVRDSILFNHVLFVLEHHLLFLFLTTVQFWLK